jgi:hypothetical protein
MIYRKMKNNVFDCWSTIMMRKLGKHTQDFQREIERVSFFGEAERLMVNKILCAAKEQERISMKPEKFSRLLSGLVHIKDHDNKHNSKSNGRRIDVSIFIYHHPFFIGKKAKEMVEFWKESKCSSLLQRESKDIFPYESPTKGGTWACVSHYLAIVNARKICVCTIDKYAISDFFFFPLVRHHLSGRRQGTLYSDIFFSYICSL